MKNLLKRRRSTHTIAYSLLPQISTVSLPISLFPFGWTDIFHFDFPFLNAIQ